MCVGERRLNISLWCNIFSEHIIKKRDDYFLCQGLEPIYSVVETLMYAIATNKLILLFDDLPIS